MMEKILPPAVTVVEAFEDPPEARLLPAEEAVVSQAVDKRRREFATARWCARRAMAELGVPPGPILPGERGAPRWPDGVVGSMTHCDGYRAAAVARAGEVRSIGIDAEPDAPLPKGVFETIALPEEQLRTVPGVHADRLLFSAKESVYKAWFPLTRRWLDFDEADIVLRADGTFSARILAATRPGEGIPPDGFTGRWTTASGLLMTAIVVM
ncbi:4'-phosphopantetheinyl transferase superfamily protein [Actinomadura decatromicini]|uniref:4'-phosphopantetheinyl transferase superfamily protein n=2 Tax=Actinomadura decatromicini TaxID=2604572 RepID=A0A5D3F764_9ACTN|nr:4'-phosphopantetheinyl transferase superfamily protein [Actinomadura decatromicini]